MKNELKLSIVLTALIFFSCGSFESISTTGKLAQKLDDHKSIYERTITVCDYLVALNSDHLEEDYCKNYSSNLKKLNTGIKVFTDYGKALEKISKDSKYKFDEKVELAISASEDAGWIDLSDDTGEGIEKIAANIAKLVTNKIKRKKLKEVILEVNDPIQKLSKEIIFPELAHRKNSYAKLLTQLTNISDSKKGLMPDMRNVYSIDGNKSDSLFVDYNDLDLLAITHLRSMIESDLNGIAKCEKALEAFTKSHQKLYDKVNKIGTKDDSKVAKEIVEIIKKIYKGVDKINV